MKILLLLIASVLSAGDFEVAPLLKEAKARSKTAASPEGAAVAPKDDSLWVSFGRSDLLQLDAAEFPLGAAVIENERVSIFQVRPELLPRLSDFMHKRFKRCGGFFAHATRAEAEADLNAPAASAGGPYTIDQKAWTVPLIPLVREAELRSTLDSLSAFNNRYYSADTGVEAARWVAARWKALAANLPGASVALVKHKEWKQPSVVLTIPGADMASEIVVLGGHLDSINGWGNTEARAPGVDDNASGIAVLTEAVRVLSSAGFRPRRTVQFMGYAAEEVGLRGSKDIADSYAKSGKKVTGVIQFDMTNFKGSPEDIFILTDNVDKNLTAFLGKLIDAYLAGVKWSTTKCGYGCSDHASWTRSGFPASVGFESAFDTMNDKLHTEQDTVAGSGGSAQHSVNFAKLAVAFASELAKTAP